MELSQYKNVQQPFKDKFVFFRRITQPLLHISMSCRNKSSIHSPQFLTKSKSLKLLLAVERNYVSRQTRSLPLCRWVFEWWPSYSLHVQANEFADTQSKSKKYNQIVRETWKWELQPKNVFISTQHSNYTIAGYL